uniref:Putative LAGLIDADG homing endonuclease n=1 Tax=Monomastix sp. (strain OKE-1) TaxID=141716 RepID=U5YDL7_MONSK|nr:putative LAGLIDADG homing endonuclease [Monomastix sp. OKE-1]AGZ90174.1 putative LAGLIDADG homing endonuclease [Monomastix sp. OKE-1]
MVDRQHTLNQTALEYLKFMQIPYIPETRDLRGSALISYLKKQHLTDLQRSVFVGNLLGDGTLCKQIGNNGSSNFKIDQAASEKGIEYVHFIYTILAPWVGTPPKLRYKNNKAHSIWFRTFRMKELDFYCKQFYSIDANGQRQKIIPSLLYKWLDDVALAIWFMNDGGKTDYGYRIHTQCFTVFQIRQLQKILQHNFGLTTGIGRDRKSLIGTIPEVIKQERKLFSRLDDPTCKTYYYLEIHAPHREQFTSLVEPFILPGFRYKLHSSTNKD